MKNRAEKTSIKIENTTVEGETIEKKVERILENKEPITDGAPEIYTERKDGVLPGYNIRTDRWEIANDAMHRVNKSGIAGRENIGKVIKLKDDKNEDNRSNDNDNRNNTSN